MKLNEVNQILKGFALNAISPEEEFNLICDYLSDFIDKVQILNLGYLEASQSFLDVIKQKNYDNVLDINPMMTFRAREDTPKLIKFYFIGYKLRCNIYSGEIFRRIPINVRTLFKRSGSHYVARLKSSDLNALYLSLI